MDLSARSRRREPILIGKVTLAEGMSDEVLMRLLKTFLARRRKITVGALEIVRDDSLGDRISLELIDDTSYSLIARKLTDGFYQLVTEPES